jgi:hypothetical protein
VLTFCVSMLVMSLVATTSMAQVNNAAAQAATPNVSSDAEPSFQKGLTLAPTIGWTTGTQEQTILGGSTLLSAVRSKSYCDPGLRQFGLAASASDTTTKKLGGTPTYLDNNDVTLDATRSASGRVDTRGYLGVGADFFGNNSLGIGLQEVYQAKYQHYFTPCPTDGQSRRWFASAGIGAGFLRQRLYATTDKLNAAVLPLTAQFSYLQGGGKGKPPALFWYFLAGYMPALTDSHAYQLSGIAGVQVSTAIPRLKINFSDSDLYIQNAPTGHRRNYQNGTVSLVFSIASKPPGPTSAPDQNGACYGGDKLQRIYCYDQVTQDACAPPNMFQLGGFCSLGSVGLRAPQPQ